MKVNSIRNYSQVSRNINFKRSAIPYPEYADGYKTKESNANLVDSFVKKISELFSSKVSEEAKIIKNEIDFIYSDTKPAPKQALLSVIA